MGGKESKQERGAYKEREGLANSLGGSSSPSLLEGAGASGEATESPRVHGLGITCWVRCSGWARSLPSGAYTYLGSDDPG